MKRLGPLPNYGDHMTIEEFRKQPFRDYDGSAFWATATEVDRDWHSQFSPNALRDGLIKPPNWATHVMWFNK